MKHISLILKIYRTHNCNGRYRTRYISAYKEDIIKIIKFKSKASIGRYRVKNILPIKKI